MTPTATNLVEIHGNTYPHREALKRMGGRWNKVKKCWEVPEAVAEQARALVPQKVCGTARRSGPRTCATCGQRINYGVYCGKCEYS